jgi:hypothetical protein
LEQSNLFFLNGSELANLLPGNLATWQPGNLATWQPGNLATFATTASGSRAVRHSSALPSPLAKAIGIYTSVALQR